MYSVMVAQQQAELFCEGYVGWDCFFSPEMIPSCGSLFIFAENLVFFRGFLFSFLQEIWCFFV